MTTLTMSVLDRELAKNDQCSVAEFHQRACELAEQCSPAGYISAHLTAWKENNYDPAKMRHDVRPSLESLRRSLMQRSYRCDGNLEHLQRTHEAMTSGVAAQHVLDTIEAHHLVKWCEVFCEVTEKTPAV
ncbi:hypothetical protein D3C85_1164830 [compost metagenome]